MSTKIDRAITTPLHSSNMGIVRSYLWAPVQTNNFAAILAGLSYYGQKKYAKGRNNDPNIITKVPMDNKQRKYKVRERLLCSWHHSDKIKCEIFYMFCVLLRGYFKENT